MTNFLSMICCISFFYLFPIKVFCQQLEKDVSLDALLNIKISTAARYEQSVSEAPASVTIITSDDIEKYGYRTLGDVLSGVKGFYISNDRNYIYAGTRGFSRPTDYNNRILLQINGHDMNENIFGSATIDNSLSLKPEIIDKIEIIRGPGSALYGNNAMFAVINIITKNGNLVNGLEISTEVGSFDRLRNSAMYGKRYNNGFDIVISGLWGNIDGEDLYFEEFDDPATNSGIAENLDTDKHHSLFTTLSYKDFTVQGIVTSLEKGIPTAPWETDFNNNSMKTEDNQTHIEIKYNYEVSESKAFNIKGYYNHYDFGSTYPFNNNPELAADYFDSSDGNWVGSELQFRWDTSPNNRIITGIEYQDHLRADYKYWGEDVIWFKGDFPYSVLSMYVQDSYQIRENLSLTLGVRRDDYSNESDTTTPRAALIYNPFKTSTVKALYGEAFRVPNTYEKNYNEEDYWKANLFLKSENIRTIELIWEQRLKKEMYGIISLYRYRMHNLIDTMYGETDELFYYGNLDKVTANGLELGFHIKLRNDLSGYFSYSFQKVEDNQNNRLSNSPGHLIKCGASYPLLNWLYAGGEMYFETERKTVYDTTTDSYFLSNFNLSTEPILKHFTFSLLAKNIFDTEYKLPGGFEHIQHGIIQSGRQLILKADYHH
ncbi:MAG: TonB-dependent receptor [Candidatus Latescibacteria bacterium]|nr:TonB-dependent receptor [Candidatus Latescibacterota bacterium]